jgi:hypothetical protein
MPSYRAALARLHTKLSNRAKEIMIIRFPNIISLLQRPYAFYLKEIMKAETLLDDVAPCICNIIVTIPHYTIRKRD